MIRYTNRSRLLGSPFSAHVAQWSLRSFVKSVQRGTVLIVNSSTTGTATITAVQLANSLVYFLGATSANVSTNFAVDARCYLTFTNETTITATRAGSSDAATAGFEVIEFQPGVLRSVQRGAITISGASTSATASVTFVDAAKCALVSLGEYSGGDVGSGDQVYQWPRLTLTNSVTVTSSRVAGGFDSTTQGFQLAEYW